MRSDTNTRERPTVPMQLPVPYALTALLLDCSDTGDLADAAGLALVQEMIGLVVGSTCCPCAAHAVTRAVEIDLVRAQVGRIHDACPETLALAYELSGAAWRLCSDAKRAA